jgi:hypothetical protein
MLFGSRCHCLTLRAFHGSALNRLIVPGAYQFWHGAYKTLVRRPDGINCGAVCFTPDVHLWTVVRDRLFKCAVQTRRALFLIVLKI